MLNKILMPLILCIAFLTACSGPEEKKLRFYNKAQVLLEKGDLIKAGLELKNAIQIDPKYADAHYLLGQVELKKGNFQKAYTSFSKAVELSPGNLDAQVEVGKLCLMQGDKDKALEIADLVLKSNSKHSEGLLLRAGVLVARKDWSAGVVCLEALISGGVTKPDAYLMLAMARNGLKDAKGAESALLEGAAKNQTSLAVQKTLADLYAATGRISEAAACIKRMITLDSANYGYSITLAGLYLDNGHKAESNEILGKLIAANSKNEECLAALAGFYLTRRQLEEAEKVLKYGIQNIPRSFNLRFALSELYRATGRGNDAVALLKECLGLEKDPKKPEIIQTRNLLARISFLRGELKDAESQIAEILKFSSTNTEATYLKGRIHLQKREAVAAISAFRSVISDRPNDPECYLLMADAHLINLEQNLAMENLLQAERLEPGSLRVVRAFARLNALQKDFRKAEERMSRYLSKHPDESEARVELGDLYRMAGNIRRAAAEYNSVKRTLPGSVIAYLRLGELYAQQGNLPAAISEMDMARKQDPDNAQTSLVLAHLYTRANNLSKARQIFEELYVKYPKEWSVTNDFACFLADYGDSKADLERAGALAKDVVAQRPDDPYSLDTLGWIEYRKGNYARSVELLEKADAGVTGHQIVSYHLGMASFYAGKKEQARTHLKKALAGGNFAGMQQADEVIRQL